MALQIPHRLSYKIELIPQQMLTFAENLYDKQSNCTVKPSKKGSLCYWLQFISLVDYLLHQEAYLPLLLFHVEIIARHMAS